MDNEQPVEGAKFGFGTPNPANNKQDIDNTKLPVEETQNTIVTAPVAPEDDEDLDASYTDQRTITISLVKNYSLYRKANDKVLPKKIDYIGGSVTSCMTLSSNKDEIENYFPALIGLAANNVDFITRVKGWFNNIRVPVDELGKTLNISFVYKKKSDYLKVKAKEEALEAKLLAVGRNDATKFKAALKDKIDNLNLLEGTKHTMGYPVKLDEYLIYRHCLLYADVAKDLSVINSSPSIRFYFKDDQKEIALARKYREQLNAAKANYVTVIADPELFTAVYTQYLELKAQPIIAGNAEDLLDKETKLDAFSREDPIKFNKIVNNIDAKLIGFIETLIAYGLLNRSSLNQNISSEEGNFIGSNMKEAVVWFKNPENLSTVNAYRAKLKNI